MLDPQRATFSYLLTFMFVMSIGIGALFLVALEYIAGADWSTPIRRIVEFFAGAIPLLLVLVIPLLLNMKELFLWTDTELLRADYIMSGKEAYLNVPFFIIRVAVVLGLWTLFYFLLTRNSRKQDSTKDQSLTTKNIKISAIFIPIFAITVTIAAVDWLMTLEPLWFSTIFGVYFFSGSVVVTLCVVTLAVVLLREHGYLHPKMIDDHYYSLGALIFAFVNFWAYIAFSQYLLIWYANLPEETFWFINRWKGGWVFVSLFLIFTHFVVPYAVLLSQPAKTNAKKLKFISIWLIFAHVVDLYWLIMPQFKTTNHAFYLYLMEFGFPIAAVGFFILLIYYKSQKNNMVPIGDPKLDRGLNFRL
ncbi:MAG: quinol:cytochrome C oxidoreductase [Chlorobiaceae bacterium]|nr:quinol:cytochrome C oxidoreductase [Chlorobiaceae bacterium]MBA4308996.1 quinol:cytochrome C oxidoreductase [Chlorobiaceae bacterium]